jgi:hypothetical protein
MPLGQRSGSARIGPGGRITLLLSIIGYLLVNPVGLS